MLAPALLARAMSRVSVTDEHGNKWQYHSRSNQHTKVAAYSMVFDLLAACSELREQVSRGLVGFALNHQLVGERRKKKVDLVLGRRVGSASSSERENESGTLASALRHEVELDASEERVLRSLPQLHRGAIGKLLVAFEVKAAMTEHGKALPRLFDELDATQTIIHQASDDALAVGLVIVNASDHFVSPDRNRHDHGLMPPEITKHAQPSAAIRVFEKVRELPVAGAAPGGEGYEALGFVTVDCTNDGEPTGLVVRAPAPSRGDAYHYDSMVERAARTYAKRFKKL